MNPRWVFLLASLALTSCGLFDDEPDVHCGAVDCLPCKSPVTVTLVVPEGQPPPEAVLEGIGGQCVERNGSTVCLIDAKRAGTYEFDIQATGYQKVHVREKVPEAMKDPCCSCPYSERMVRVELTPL